MLMNEALCFDPAHRHSAAIPQFHSSTLCIYMARDRIGSELRACHLSANDQPSVSVVFCLQPSPSALPAWWCVPRRLPLPPRLPPRRRLAPSVAPL